MGRRKEPAAPVTEPGMEMGTEPAMERAARPLSGEPERKPAAPLDEGETRAASCNEEATSGAALPEEGETMAELAARLCGFGPAAPAGPQATGAPKPGPNHPAGAVREIRLYGPGEAAAGEAESAPIEDAGASALAGAGAGDPAESRAEEPAGAAGHTGGDPAGNPGGALAEEPAGNLGVIGGETAGDAEELRRLRQEVDALRQELRRVQTASRRMAQASEASAGPLYSPVLPDAAADAFVRALREAIR